MACFCIAAFWRHCNLSTNRGHRTHLRKRIEMALVVTGASQRSKESRCASLAGTLPQRQKKQKN